MQPFLRFGFLGLATAIAHITLAGSLAGAALLWMSNVPEGSVRTWMPMITGVSGVLAGIVGVRAWRKQQAERDGA